MTKLTPATARDLTFGETLRDHEVIGLRLCANKTSKSWELYYRTRAGIERRPKLGSFPEMSLARARDAAKAIKDRVAIGEDPGAEWQAARAAPTVNELCNQFLNEWGPKHQSKRTLHENELLIERHIRPGLGSKKVADVTRKDVDTFLENVLNRKYVPAERVAKDGHASVPSAANHVRSLLRHLFNLAHEDFGYAIQKVDGAPLNPVTKTVRQPSEPRQRLAQPAELCAILTGLGALEATKPAHAAALWTLIFCGGRVGEVEHATKEQYDGSALVLQKHKTFKKIGTKRVRLPAFICEMVDRLDAKGDRLFGDIALKRVWNDIRVKAGCPDLQMRDARRTFASYALRCGYGLDAIGKLLHHTNIRTTGGYSWLTEEGGDEMIERIAQTMLQHGGALPAASPAGAGQSLANTALASAPTGC